MQEYHYGDHVRINAEMPEYRSHFIADEEAIVIGSYGDQYGTPDSGGDYTLYIKGHGQCSWYPADTFTLIENGRIDLLTKWQAEKEAEDKLHSDLDWIFANGEAVLENAPGATVAALARCLGITNMWGSHGEGYVWYMNALRVMAYAEPYLRTGDKQGFLDSISAASKE